MIVVDFTEEDVEALNYKRYHFERLWKFVKKMPLFRVCRSLDLAVNLSNNAILLFFTVIVN